jgi:acyl-CoA reductase-like NAD-dependent aldehyde dehydrogenase
MRLTVRKMHKLFIGGAFVRSESARSDAHVGADGEPTHVPRASRKDARDAVVAARAGYTAWTKATPANRGLVLYRLAEMMESRRAHLEAALDGDAAREVDAAIDRVVYYAGWCDKYLGVASQRNPVPSPFDAETTSEPTGVVAVVAPARPALLGLVTLSIPPLVAGNGVVAFASETFPLAALAFAECVATSDLPAGAWNVLVGARSECVPTLASHMDVNAFGAAGLTHDETVAAATAGAANVKRMHVEDDDADWFSSAFETLARVTAYTERKTIWQTATV